MSRRSIAVLVMLFLLQSDIVCSQPPTVQSSRTVASTGQATLRVSPDRMRMALEIVGRGNDVPTATASLKERTKAAQAQLKQFQAIADSIQIHPMQVDDGQSQQHQQLRERLMEGLNELERDTENLAPLVTVSTILTAEWKLSSASEAERLAQVHDIQTRVRAADLSGRDDASGLPPESQELLEESMMLSASYGYGAEDTGPRFVFYRNVSADQYAALLKTALQRATDRATLLAAAADLTIGEIVHLKRVSAADAQAFEEQFSYLYGVTDSGSLSTQELVRRVADPTDGSVNVIGETASQVSLVVNVSVEFSIE